MIAALLVGTIAWQFAFSFAPFSWTGEPARLARVLRLEAGMKVADIDAGSGALAIAMAEFVGATSQGYATELLSAFQAVGLRLRERADDWGCGVFLLVFERAGAGAR